MDGTWRDLHTRLIKARFGEKADTWQGGGFNDDRAIYCNLYRRMLDALEQLPDEPCNYIRVAMNNKLKEDCKTLAEIRAVFKDR